MKLPLLILTATILAGCTYDEQRATYKAINGAVSGYYDRPAVQTTTTTVNQDAAYLAPMPAYSPNVIYAQ